MTSAFLASLTLCRGPVLEQLTCRAASARALSREAEGWNALPDAALALSWSVPLELDESDGAVRVEENFRREHVARTGALIEPSPQQRLTRAGSGAVAERASVELEFSWEEQLAADQPRVLFAAWQRPATSWLLWAAPLAAVCAGGLAWVASRASRKRHRAAT
ncbi:MAG TPA: hypothetical protein VFZ61_19370 [Polyangiales bacterium]